MDRPEVRAYTLSSVLEASPSFTLFGVVALFRTE